MQFLVIHSRNVNLFDGSFELNEAPGQISGDGIYPPNVYDRRFRHSHKRLREHLFDLIELKLRGVHIVDCVYLYVFVYCFIFVCCYYHFLFFLFIITFSFFIFSFEFFFNFFFGITSSFFSITH